MANPIVSLTLAVKNMLSGGVKEAAEDVNKLKDRSAELQRELAKLENAQNAAKGLKEARDAAKEAEKGFEQAQLEVERLKDALKSERTPELAVALIKGRDAAKEAKAEWKQSEKEVSRLEATIKRAGGNVDDMATTEKMLAEQLNITSGAIKRNNEELGKTGDHLNESAQAADKAGISFGSMAAKITALVGGLAIFSKIKDGIKSLGQSVWETGNQFEQFATRLNAEEFGYIEEFTKTAPLGLDQVADAFLRLKNFGLDPMDGTLQALIDKNAQLGGSMDSLNGIILQLGQGWTKQKLQSQDIIAIMERGIPVWDLLSQAMNKTVAEVQDMASAGELGRKEIRLLIEAMGDSAIGESAKQMETMSGSVALLQGRFTSFYKQISDAGVWEYLKQQMSELLQYIDNLAASGELEKIAKNIADGFIVTAETIKGFITTLYDLRGELGLLAKAWLSIKIASWGSQIAAAATSFGALTAGARTATVAIKSLALAMKATIGIAIVQGVYEVATAYGELKKAVSDLEKAKKAEAESSERLAERFREISETTGIVVRNMKELDAAVAAGKIVIDEQAGAYLSAEQAAKKFAKAQQDYNIEAIQAELENKRLAASIDAVSASLEEAEGDTKKLADSLKKNIQEALKDTEFGAEELARSLSSIGFAGDETAEQLNAGFKQALDSLSDKERTEFGKAIEAAMKQAGDGSDAAKAKLKQLQDALDAVNVSRVEAAMKQLGITSQATLQEIATKAKTAFDDIRAGETHIKDQEAAFLAWAKAAVDASEGMSAAARQSTIEQLKATAATLGMKDQLNELLGIQQQLGKQGTDTGNQIRKGTDNAAEGMQQLADKTDEAKERAGGLGAALANILNGARQQMLELSEATAALFDQRMGLKTSGVVTEMEALKASIAGTRAELGEMYLAASKPDFTGIGRFIQKVGEAHHSSKLAFQEQKLEALKLMEAMNNAGNLTQNTINNASNAIGRLNLLGKEDLSTLRSALDSANAKLVAMKDNAKSTLDSLKDQLDRLQQNQDAIDKREYENKKAELMAAIESAKRMGNQDAIKSYTESLKVLEQIRQEKNKQAQAAAQEKAKSAAQEKQTKAAETKATPAASKAIDININLGGKKTTVQAANQSEADAFINFLTQAGLTTL